MKEHDLPQLAEDLQKTLLELHDAQRINRDIYDYFSKPKLAKTIAKILWRQRRHIDGILRFEPVSMKSMDGSEFPFVRILFTEDLEEIPKKRLKVFVGHRFVNYITQPLRFNLARILNP